MPADHEPDGTRDGGRPPPGAGTGGADDVGAFEQWRPLLFGIAYRMLGSAGDAEDMVQETYLRWLQRRERDITSVRAYLVTILTRLCIDQLASARVQRERYSGPWLPEPVATDDTEAVEQSDSLSLAFLVLLEELTPPERAAYLLHDVFGYQFDEVAGLMGRSDTSCRQLASRARRSIEDRRQRFDSDRRHAQDLTRRFVVACGSGDMGGLLAMLADDVVVWTDGGGRVRAAMRPVVGPHRSSRFLANVGKKFHAMPREVVLNNQPAVVFVDEDHVVGTLSIDVMDGKVAAVRVVTNPEKLGHLQGLFAGGSGPVGSAGAGPRS
ncbi:MAG TPA: RNA polymerase sigma-70 factor [Acidimicrobiales bacterium]|nr:RNA polymerase sigma-70 factor [Acidimicrobiales bacterium]